MPYETIQVPADLYVDYDGVKVYRTYKNDDKENGPRTYWFVTDPYHNEDEAFDVRDLPGWDDAFRPLYRDVRETYRATQRAIYTTLIRAIDEGVLTSRGVKERV